MTGNSMQSKFNEIIEKAESYSWVYYVIVLVILGLIRFGIVTGQDMLIDVVLTITSIPLASQAINKIRNKKSSTRPTLQCLKCSKDIDPVGEWKCKSCGWSSTWPDNQKP